jgi:hypothetical protein
MKCTSFWRPAATQNAVSDGTTFVFVRYENSTYRVVMDVGSTVSAFQIQLYLATGVLPMCQRLVGFEGMRFFTHTDIVLTLNAYADSRTHTSCSQRMHSLRSYTVVASSLRSHTLVACSLRSTLTHAPNIVLTIDRMHSSRTHDA